MFPNPGALGIVSSHLKSSFCLVVGEVSMFQTGGLSSPTSPSGLTASINTSLCHGCKSYPGLHRNSSGFPDLQQFFRHGCQSYTQDLAGVPLDLLNCKTGIVNRNDVVWKIILQKKMNRAVFRNVWWKWETAWLFPPQKLYSMPQKRADARGPLFLFCLMEVRFSKEYGCCSDSAELWGNKGLGCVSQFFRM